jgi:hypothetical protein
MAALEKNYLQVSINLNKLFPKGFPTYQVPPNNKQYGSYVKPSSLRGVTLPGQSYVAQTRAARQNNRLYRNSTVDSLPDGSYLYMIEVSKTPPYRYYKQFIKVEDRLEVGTKHFQIATREPNRTILAAGELKKKGSEIKWNLSSGTFMAKFLNQHKNTNAFKRVVENAFRNSSATRKIYTTQNLLNVKPTKLGHLLRKINEGGIHVKYNNSSNGNSNSKNLVNMLRARHQERIAAGETTVNSPGKSHVGGNTPQSKFARRQ